MVNVRNLEYMYIQHVSYQNNEEKYSSMMLSLKLLLLNSSLQALYNKIYSDDRRKTPTKQQTKGWKRNNSKCFFIKKQIEPFHINPSLHSSQESKWFLTYSQHIVQGNIKSCCLYLSSVYRHYDS